MSTRVHYTDMLTATDGRMLSRSGMNGVYEIFEAIAGPGVTTISLAYLGEPVGKYLKEKYPAYANTRVSGEIDTVLELWRDKFPDESMRNSRECKDALQRELDKHVLPLVGEEYVEVESISEEMKSQLLDGYSGFLSNLWGNKS
jgi:hypothetical protein